MAYKGYFIINLRYAINSAYLSVRQKFFHDNLTLPKSTEKMLTRAAFELASAGYRSAALPVELSSPQGLEGSFYPT